MTDWLTDFEHIAILLVRQFAAFVRSLRLSTPQPPVLLSRQELDMAWAYTYSNPEPNTAPDWSKREFIATIDGVETVIPIEPKDTLEPIVIKFPENSSVSLLTRDYDDAQPTPLHTDSVASTFTVLDDVPPAEPGAPVFVSKVEVPD